MSAQAFSAKESRNNKIPKMVLEENIRSFIL